MEPVSGNSVDPGFPAVFVQRVDLALTRAARSFSRTVESFARAKRLSGSCH
jgi:hypothetical protein